MEPFQQYLAEKFSKDSKHSTSSVVNELGSTFHYLLKDPHGTWSAATHTKVVM